MYKISAPGSLMLLGEHAVLHSQKAITCAINKRVEVELIPDESKFVKINSNLGNFEIFLEEVNDLCQKIYLNKSKIKNFEYVLACIDLFINNTKNNGIESNCTCCLLSETKSLRLKGFTLNINANFSSQVGFGSSAAVTVCTIALLYRWLYAKKIDNYDLLNLAKTVVLSVAKRGSGADLATSIFGGVLLYQPINYFDNKQVKDELEILNQNCQFNISNVERLPVNFLNITALYSGYKIATKDVIKKVEKKAKDFPLVYQNLYALMGQCVDLAKEEIINNNLDKLGKLMNVYHGLLASLGVSDLVLDFLSNKLRQQSNIFGAKISGAGLGDCIIGIGELSKSIFENEFLQSQPQCEYFALTVDKNGLLYEEERVSCYNFV